jgi:hypothetical protein
MEIAFFVALIGLSIVGLLALDRDNLKSLDTDEFFEDDEYFIDHT